MLKRQVQLLGINAIAKSPPWLWKRIPMRWKVWAMLTDDTPNDDPERAQRLYQPDQ